MLSKYDIWKTTPPGDDNVYVDGLYDVEVSLSLSLQLRSTAEVSRNDDDAERNYKIGEAIERDIEDIVAEINEKISQGDFGLTYRPWITITPDYCNWISKRK